ncbi:PI-PLC X domain-containing protein 1-like isoform X7 [Dunckerocampus dactyliophorus]|uniref:PI-PLC X domain-containing protein 1-like isoform X7 n=1 Tax=Dunckerocampus dactyliophorus TaxID=161453 RepID=UPI00240602F0|nr:PI-PLC X domain-containing protein 1-like isoform X7 [Dunckerocampus dactyliophorus]
MGDKLDEGNSVWMSRLPEKYLDVSLWNLAIPGSHDSMSFCLDVSSPVLESESRFLKVLDKLAPCWTRPCVSRWATTQEALDELATWLDAHPREVVIICCSHFADLTLSDHTQLVEYLISLFGPKLCSSQDNPTLRSCWSTGQQVIVSYENQEMVQCHPELWTGIPYWYADSPDPNKVIAYLEAQKHKGRPAGFYISGLNLTEHAPYILFHPFQSMRKMTTQATTVLLGWVREQRPGPQADSVNIICCDFVDVAQFCDYVIGLNYKGGVDRDKKTGQDLGSSPPVKNADSKRASCRVREAKLRASSIHSSVCPIAVAL